MSDDPLVGLIRYDQAANRQTLDALRATPEAPDRARAVFAHLLAAQRVWAERLTEGGTSRTPVWPDLSLDECKAWLDTSGALFDRVLAPEASGEASLDAKVQYRNTRGVGFENTVREVLLHVVLHGAYHRGQIAAFIREAGGTPPLTDYIFHVRHAE